MGGKADDERSKKVKIPHSSAIVQGIAENTIKWTDAPEFSYEVAEDVPGVDDDELLQPWRLYERQGRGDEYRAFADRLSAERTERLREFPLLREEIIRAIA